MIGFWISATAMVAMVALVLVQALRQGRSAALAAPGAEDLGVYRDQLAEIDRDLTKGSLQAPEADRMRIEVQRRMLDADRSASADAPGSAWVGAGTVATLAALAAAFALYVTLGAPGYPDLPLNDRLTAARTSYANRPAQATIEAALPAYSAPDDADPAMLALMPRLRAAVVSHPDDLQGQTLLVQNETALANYPAARRAQEAVVRLKGDAVTANDFATLALVTIYAAQGAITPEAEAALARCLKLDPTNGLARYYVGLMFAQVDRPDETFRFWQPLLAEGPADAPWITPIRDRIEAVADAAGIKYALPQAGPDAAAVAAAAQMTTTDQQSLIKSMVDGLDARLTASGGPVEDWAKLITSRAVLRDLPAARAAYATAQTAFVGQPGALAALRAAAAQAGITP